MNRIHNDNSQYYQPPWSGDGCHHGHSQGPQDNQSYYRTSGVPHGAYASYTPKAYSSPCSQCNPSKLYADTYSYLTENFMRPVVEEVYQDLKSITAANTVANNSAASKMGLQNVPQGHASNAVPVGNAGNLQAQNSTGKIPSRLVQPNANPARQIDFNQRRSGLQSVPIANQLGPPGPRYSVV